jgi:GMP synthase (glutamine-hydrolysing)
MLGPVKPFLLLATRPEDAVADAEYRAFLRFGALPPERLVRVRLESASLDDLLPDIDLTAYAGVLVGGSPFTSSDPPAEKSPVQQRVEAELERVIRDVLKHDVPFLGACYGISTLGRHLGGVVDVTFAEPVGAVPVTLTEAGVADPLLAGVPRTFLAFVGHKEALLEVPEDAELLAGSAGCPVQMFRVGKNQYATQFHPELDVPGIVERIWAYRYAGYFAPDEVEALVAEVSRADVVWPARILANFVERYG